MAFVRAGLLIAALVASWVAIKAESGPYDAGHPARVSAGPANGAG